MPSKDESTSLDDQLIELISLFEKGLNHQTSDVYQIAKERPDDHFYVHMISGLLRSIDGVLSMDKDILEDALNMLKTAATSCNKYRRRSSWFSRADYNSYSDGE